MQIQEWMPGVDLKVFLGGVHNLGMAQLTANGEIKSWKSLLRTDIQTLSQLWFPLFDE